jgi:dolichol-phosphate mannosyltransferase
VKHGEDGRGSVTKQTELHRAQQQTGGAERGLRRALRTGVTILVPAKNEERMITEVVERVAPYGDEVVVIDGHSTDKTRELAEASGASVVVDNGKGKGAALRMGMDLAAHDVIVFFDADGSHDALDIPKLVAPIRAGEADLVVASRMRGGSDELYVEIHELSRLFGNLALQFMINRRFGAKLTDCNNGFRAIRTEVGRRLGLRENDAPIEMEMMMKCLKQGYRVTEVPSHERKRRYGSTNFQIRKLWYKLGWCLIRNMF